MFSKQEKKEMREDTLSKKSRRNFEMADKKGEALAKKYISDLTVDKVIKFLMDAQKTRGPFPISKTMSTTTRNLKL